MYRFIGRLAVAAVLAAVFMVCGVGAAADAPGKARLVQAWTVEAEYPQTGVAEMDRRVREWLEAHINATMAEVAVVSVHPEYDGESWDMGVGFETVRSLPMVVSVVFETYTNPSRAAHPMARRDVLNFNGETGRELGLGDLFADPERALAIMAEHAPRLVEAALREANPEAQLDGDAWFADGFSPTRENYAALVPEKGGVRVIFQKYQILPYVFGMPEALIPLGLLEPAGPNCALWVDGADCL